MCYNIRILAKNGGKGMENGRYTVGLYTLGCKVSQYETEAIAEEFARVGFAVRPFDDPCDVYVINTCTVTQESDRKSRQFIRRASAANPGALVMVCGCYAQADPAAVAAVAGVSYVTGTAGKMRLPAQALALLENRPSSPVVEVTPLDGETFEPMCVHHAPRTRAYVKIEDGCECRCTYCAISGARGPVRSKPMDDVLREVADLSRTSREIVLTGIETASWGVDLGKERLIDLLEAIDRLPGVSRIRLGSLSPELIRPDFVSRFAALRAPAHHLHLAMQSGSDPVLRGMKRRYNREMALTAFRSLRAVMPDVQFTTDMMVGFPGETDACFEETMDFVREVGFLDMHVFAYSRRPGTPAADYPDQVPEDVKHARSARLIHLAAETRAVILDRAVAGKEPLSVLFETCENGRFCGHSDTFFEVAVPDAGDDLRGKTRTVLPVAREGRVIVGRLAHNP